MLDVDRERASPQYERGEHDPAQPWNHYDEQSEAYLHYVLALAGKGKKARILKLIERIAGGREGRAAPRTSTC